MTKENATTYLRCSGFSEEHIKEISDALKEWPKPGDWIVHHNGNNDYIECSECWSWYVGSYLTRRNYCPNCGAKMQEGDKE